jgi:hypothetical protein
MADPAGIYFTPPTLNKSQGDGDALFNQGDNKVG